MTAVDGAAPPPATGTTPGLVCSHHHLYSALARGMPAPSAPPTTFRQILERVWWRLDRALDEDTIHWSATLGALEALESGCTAIIDHHASPSCIDGSLDIVHDAVRAVGLRVTTCFEVTDRNGAAGASAGLAENVRYLEDRVLSDPDTPGWVGAHACFTLSDETLDAVVGTAEDLGVGVHVHVAEGPEDVGAGARLDGRTGDDWLLVHAVHLDRPLAGTVVHNPRSNSNNHVGWGDPARWSGPVALGTDGIGADMLEEVRYGFARARDADRDADPTTTWSYLATGWDLFPAARRDRVTWSTPHVEDPWRLAYTTGTRPLTVEVEGRVVLDADGPTLVDATEVRARAAEAATRLHRRMEAL